MPKKNQIQYSYEQSEEAKGSSVKMRLSNPKFSVFIFSKKVSPKHHLDSRRAEGPPQPNIISSFNSNIKTK
jgi:hypothetical protein